MLCALLLRQTRRDAARVDGRHPLRNVAHIGGSSRHAPGSGLGEIHVAAQRGGVRDEHRQLPVVPELRVARTDLDQVPLASSG